MNIAKPLLQTTVPPALLPPFLFSEELYKILAEQAPTEEVSPPSRTSSNCLSFYCEPGRVWNS